MGIPVVAVQLVRAGEPPGAVGPRAHVGLVADVRAEVRTQVRRLLVLAYDVLVLLLPIARHTHSVTHSLFPTLPFPEALDNNLITAALTHIMNFRSQLTDKTFKAMTIIRKIYV